ncbi:MAG: UdgX family uracil-DNA binding protein [Acidimicrobiaceae bacterium]|nr:UdgX family uracil-DNA binding protein [Acidimicrobiaceae bacterium]
MDTARRELETVREQASACRACGLWQDATQTVFGEGPVPAAMMLVGEQPGDQEDRAGHVFVGPAGRVLDEALQTVGVKRGDTYLTNAVKHFKWQPRGKRRIHDRPNRTEMVACRPWLDRELELVRPQVLVLLGATAAQTLLGSSFRLTHHRGEVLRVPDVQAQVLATSHPSAVLRAVDSDARRLSMQQLVDDLQVAADLLAQPA